MKSALRYHRVFCFKRNFCRRLKQIRHDRSSCADYFDGVRCDRQRRGARSSAWNFRPVGSHLGWAIRYACSRSEGLRLQGSDELGAGEPQDHASRSAVARRARNLQHHARKHELRHGWNGRRPDSIHARGARGDGQSRGGEIPRRSLRAHFWQAASAISFPPGHPLSTK